MLCYVMLCYVMLRYVTLRLVLLRSQSHKCSTLSKLYICIVVQRPVCKHITVKFRVWHVIIISCHLEHSRFQRVSQLHKILMQKLDCLITTRGDHSCAYVPVCKQVLLLTTHNRFWWNLVIAGEKVTEEAQILSRILHDRQFELYQIY